MKSFNIIFAVLICVLFQRAGYAESSTKQFFSEKSIVRLNHLPEAKGEDFGTLLFSAGYTWIDRLSVTTDYYNFDYPNSMRSFTLGAAWEKLPLKFIGDWGVQFGASYQSYAASFSLKGIGNSSVKFHVFPVSAGTVYQANVLPALKWFLPTFATGLTYSAYFQTGDLDGVHQSGGAWNYYYSAGFRHRLTWLNFENTSLYMDVRRSRKLNSDEFALEGDSAVLGLASRI
jgi:hypothetical protein